jgi:Peptidase family M23
LCCKAAVGGCLLTNGHMNRFVYELPFQPGRRFRVCQGYGGTYSHTGDDHFSLDFDIPEGTPVCAAWAGVVYHVVDHYSGGGPHPSFKPKGNVIYMFHADDTIAAYIHLAFRGARVRAGEFVGVEAVIGLSGSTGWSGRPHLHFHVADAIDHRRHPTRFNTVEAGVTTLEADRSYTRSASGRPAAGGAEPGRPASTRMPRGRAAGPASYCPDLLSLAGEVAADLTAAGYEALADYTSVEAMHDVCGLEVCGIRQPDLALDITRLLLRRFPGWNAGWLDPADGWASQEWVARVQRDREPVPESWDTD